MSIRINKYIAQATGLSRRAVDEAIQQNRVTVNGDFPSLGQTVSEKDAVVLDGKTVAAKTQLVTVLFNKPVGYVCSRDGQGSQTVYDLLPQEYHELKTVGRLDKDSSGLLLLTNDGQLAHQLTHPGFQKKKVYQIEINKPLQPADQAKIEQGVELEDGISLLRLKGEGKTWQITMFQGRNRQIRRTFETLGYTVTKLHRTQFGDYKLGKINEGESIIS